MKDQLRETQLQSLDVPPPFFFLTFICVSFLPLRRKRLLSVLQEKKAMFYFMYFFLDYFNVSGDRVCFTKILVGKKKKEKQAPKQSSWIKQTLNMCLLCII